MLTKPIFLFSKKNVFSILVFLYLLSAFVYLPKHLLAFPRVFAGDEPHYLAVVRSLVVDFDWDLSNNYDDPFFREDIPLDPHHVHFRLGGEEFSGHPPGLPFLAAAVFFHFRGSPLLESACVLFSTCLVLFSLYFLYELLFCFLGEEHVCGFTVLVFGLATPLWHYSKTFFSEPLLFFLLFFSLYLLVVKENYFLAGVFLGYGFVTKSPALVFPAVCFFFLLARKKFGELFLFTLPVVFFVVVLFSFNYLFYDKFGSLQRFIAGDLLGGVFGLLLSKNHGLLVFSPFLVFSIFSWFFFLRKSPFYASFFLNLFLSYFVVMALWVVWWGGLCYSARLVLPVVPLLAFGQAFWLRDVLSKPLSFPSKVFLLLFLLLLAYSLYQGAYAAFFNTVVWQDIPSYFDF